MEITLDILKERYLKKIQEMFTYGNIGLQKKEDEVVAYEERGITKEHGDELVKLALDNDFSKLVHYDNEEDFYNDLENETPEWNATFAPCHALMALASFGLDKEAQKIIDNFDNIDPYDDNYLFAFVYYFASIYAQNMEFINTLIFDESASKEKKVYIFYIFEEIISSFKNQKSLNAIEEVSVEFLKSNERDSELNALAINTLVRVDGIKHIEVIRESYAKKSIDEFYADSLENIEIKLGLREKAPPKVNTPKEEPQEPVFKDKSVGRNDPCPCGSGKKYKKCCLHK